MATNYDQLSMEETLPCSILLVLFLLIAFKFWSQSRTHHSKLPPSPAGSLPILGHLHLLKQPIHQTFQNLSHKYGPIISLRFGSRLVVVVSSPSAVEECFTKNDIVLANRPVLTIGTYLDYNNTTITTSPCGDHWRNLRRLSSVEIFSTNRLNKFSSIRRDEMNIFLNNLYRASMEDFAKVELRPVISELTFNIIFRMVTGKRYCGQGVSDIDGKSQFKEIIQESMKLGEASYPGDFLPFLKWVDYQGFIKKVKVLGKRIDLLLQGLIDEQRNDGGGNNTMISHLLSLQESEPEYYSDEIIKGIILSLIFAGTDTTAVTLEWAMSNLLNNPVVLQKAKNELDIEIGNETLIEELDLPKLSYLRNIATETLRLHPAGPMLLPHFSSNDCTIGGYDVPKNTILFVNAWGIHRDPVLWEDALKFKPERHGDQAGYYNYKFIPFGLGRRVCPGMSLANRVLGFALGSMIQCFDWKRVNDKEIDMAEGSGLTMPKAEPLEAMCKPRESSHKLLSSLKHI